MRFLSLVAGLLHRAGKAEAAVLVVGAHRHRNIVRVAGHGSELSVHTASLPVEMVVRHRPERELDPDAKRVPLRAEHLVVRGTAGQLPVRTRLVHGVIPAWLPVDVLRRVYGGPTEVDHVERGLFITLFLDPSQKRRIEAAGDLHVRRRRDRVRLGRVWLRGGRDDRLGRHAVRHALPVLGRPLGFGIQVAVVRIGTITLTGIRAWHLHDRVGTILVRDALEVSLARSLADFDIPRVVPVVVLCAEAELGHIAVRVIRALGELELRGRVRLVDTSAGREQRNQSDHSNALYESLHDFPP